MVGILELTPIPLLYVAIILGWFFIFGILVNDQIKKLLMY
jgi:hypothetical protein